ncbi:phosphomevalonate kinase Ecym_6245 [Eremothecium cymbalariae DBVPG|uniref:Phosphomevalonate kinase n=1 Tax=Eremothecium cymbalariae (strain CBS 270.75 / DBVPG 7215 / KCTC 17166 / NRRL Y-17582) TaxID=931890 RepID=G8JVE8_ERECY|nr:hypothetical protein Ecym_6245 [Eremothecium cymbalariae DBVPG\
MDVSRSFSVPGKVLLAGGYLILKSKYQAYVVALSSRMHAVVYQERNTATDGKFKVTVTSSQFNNDQWIYSLDPSNNYALSEASGRKNPFVEKTIINVFVLFSPKVAEYGHIFVNIFSDSGYHSQNDSIERSNGYKRFRFHNQSISAVPKTGLGSSAGLVTVLTTALVSVFNTKLDINTDSDLFLIHNISQISHCQAQGKIGSGFDVAAAVFGTILYRRFDPQLINCLPNISSPEYPRSICQTVRETHWGVINRSFSLPKGLRIVMGDVSNGSETPKLVSKVKAWYDAYWPHSLQLYKDIDKANMRFIDGLNELNNLSINKPAEYSELLAAIQRGNELDRYPVLKNIRAAVNSIREKFRMITLESGADIEPLKQTQLLENSMKLKGVLTGMVPGAGGHDAIALIVTDYDSLIEQTGNSPTFSAVTWLDVMQEEIGILEEDPSHYQNFT